MRRRKKEKHNTNLFSCNFLYKTIKQTKNPYKYLCRYWWCSCCCFNPSWTLIKRTNVESHSSLNIPPVFFYFLGRIMHYLIYWSNMIWSSFFASRMTTQKLLSGLISACVVFNRCNIAVWPKRFTMQPCYFGFDSSSSSVLGKYLCWIDLDWFKDYKWNGVRCKESVLFDVHSHALAMMQQQVLFSLLTKQNDAEIHDLMTSLTAQNKIWIYTSLCWMKINFVIQNLE